MTRISPNKILFYNWQQMRFPMHLQIDLCGACNQDCIWCFYKGDYDPNTDVTRSKLRKFIIKTDPLLRILNEIGGRYRDLGLKHAVTFVGGGEPTLHPDFYDICHRLFAWGIPYGVITNLAVKEIGRLEALKWAKWVRVSLDAMTEKTYNDLHRPKSDLHRPKSDRYGFRTVLENVKYLAQHTTVGISFLVHPDNFTEISLIADHVDSLGFKYVEFKPVYTEDRENLYPNGLESTIQKLIDQLKIKCPELEIIDLFSKNLNTLAKTDYPKINCRVPCYRIQIGSDGNVYPCCIYKYVPEYSLGSIYGEYSLGEIMRSETAMKVLDNLKVDSCPPCWDRDTQILLNELDKIENKEFV